MKCAICDKTAGLLQCGKCKRVSYCGREHQRQHWRVHKKECRRKTLEDLLRSSIASAVANNPEPSAGDEGCFLPEPAVLDTLNRLGLMEGIKLYDLPKDYEKHYGKNRIFRGHLEAARTKFALRYDVFERYEVTQAEGRNLGGLMERWGVVGRPLFRWLSESRYFGDVWKGKMKTPGLSDEKLHQDFSIIHKEKLILEPGKTHVSVEFTDLLELLVCETGASQNLDKPFRFVGYDRSAFVVAKTKVLLEMLQQNAPLQSILEVWYSTLWSLETLKDFRKALKDTTSTCSDTDIRIVLDWWSQKTSDISDELNVSSFGQQEQLLASGIFMEMCIALFNLSNSRDRADYAHHILTGQFPLGNSDKRNLLYSPLHHSGKPSALEDRQWGMERERMSVLSSLDVMQIALQNPSKRLFQCITEWFRERVKRLRSWIVQGELTVTIFHESISPEKTEIHLRIRELNPDSISWGDLPDFVSPYSHFHSMARACSAPETKHIVCSTAWRQEVYGLDVLDLPQPRRNFWLAEALEDASRKYEEKIKTTKSSRFLREQIVDFKTTLFSYVMGLRCSKKWILHFLSCAQPSDQKSSAQLCASHDKFVKEYSPFSFFNCACFFSYKYTSSCE